MLTGRGEQCLGLGEQHSPLGFAHHGDAPAPPELQDPLVSEEPEGTEHGVRVDPGHGRHVLGGREPLTWSHESVGNVPADFGGYLVVERCRSPEQLDIPHDDMQSITIMGPLTWRGGGRAGCLLTIGSAAGDVHPASGGGHPGREPTAPLDARDNPVRPGDGASVMAERSGCARTATG